MSTVLVGFMVFAGIIAIDVLSIAWAAYVLSILWGWFAVPLFGLRALSVPEALGVALIVGAMARPYVPSREGDTGERIAMVFLKPALALLIGWVTLKFI
jgi:hypothetical protein